MPRTFARIDLPLVSPGAEPPGGDGWLHEIKHDGHRLVASCEGGGGLRLISRNGFDAWRSFGRPFADMLANRPARHDH